MIKDKINRKHLEDFYEKLLAEKNYRLKNEKINIDRTNHTSLSAYFRNMYNAITIVNDNKLLTDKEKKRLIKIYRAQLSNPELYVLYLNIESRFGKKWIGEPDKTDNLILKYEFIKNLPLTYCGKYSPKDRFPMNYEEEELSS